MTKEELKEKLTKDPEARAKFLASASKFYNEIGLGAEHEDLTAIKSHVARFPEPFPWPHPIVIVIIPFAK